MEKDGKLIRTPKNQLRLADDLALQIQVKDRGGVLWECLAIQGPNVTVDDFDARKRRNRSLTVLGFSIQENPKDKNAWLICPTIASVADGATQLKRRIIETLTPEFYRDRFVMMVQHCLECGKRMTDAVSMQRMVGPDCFGQNSNLTPLYSRPADIKYESPEEFWAQVTRETC